MVQVRYPWCCASLVAAFVVVPLVTAVLFSGVLSDQPVWMALHEPAENTVKQLLRAGGFGRKASTASILAAIDGGSDVRKRLRGHSVDNTGGTRADEPSQSLLFVGVFSAPNNIERRMLQRKTCFPAYRKAGFDVKFFVGRPSDWKNPISNGQGQRATKTEFEASQALAKELETYGDIVMVPLRDYYRDTTDKLISLYRYGLDQNTRYVAKVDDDICLQVDEFKRTMAREKSDSAIYGGVYLFNGKEYTIMAGADGTIAPFMAGPIEVLSRPLALIIFQDLANYVALYSIYGTSSEDANLGKWVNHVKKLKLADVKLVTRNELQGPRTEVEDKK